MGVCQSTSQGGQNQKAINAQLAASQKESRELLKILLLGSGESGKSTFFKQMKILHAGGFEESERSSFVRIIHSNCVEGMADLLIGAAQLELHIEDDDLKLKAEAVELAAMSKNALTTELADSIVALWACPVLKEAFKRHSEFQISGSAKYFFENVTRIATAPYTPTDQDILRSRVRSTGVTEMKFDVDGLKFNLYDMGGQRSERRKWVHCFEDVHAVLFVASVAEYDQMLFEDETQNRMRETMTVFYEVCNNRFFLSTAMILFLNKKDIFIEKLSKSSLSDCFPDFMGGSDYEAATKFIASKFKALNENNRREVFVHMTCATDTNNVNLVFNAVKEMIVAENIMLSGLM